MADIPFGLSPRQMNLTAIRVQEGFGKHFASLQEASVVKLNVAQDETQTLDIQIQDMSSPVLVAFLLQIIAANNLALTEQLRDLGLEARIVPEIQSSDFDADE